MIYYSCCFYEENIAMVKQRYSDTRRIILYSRFLSAVNRLILLEKIPTAQFVILRYGWVIWRKVQSK